jgi:hypothetical protein
MQRTFWIASFALLIAFLGCQQPSDSTDQNQGWDLKPPAPGAAAVVAEKKLPGVYPAGSRINDLEAPGGFGPCNNYPKNLGDKDWGKKGTISVIAFPDELVAYFKHRGLALRVVNRTDEVALFRACDSCLFLTREARDSDGIWREIESPPRAICGNSFHRVALKPDQYWEFPARVYSGPIKAPMRFRLNRTNGEPPIYSNEFEGELAADQFEEQEEDN